jgi:hypothetical protein
MLVLSKTENIQFQIYYQSLHQFKFESGKISFENLLLIYNQNEATCPTSTPQKTENPN